MTEPEIKGAAERYVAASLIAGVRMIMLAMWLGAAVYFSATVAPAAFGVLRGADVSNASELAGNIVSRTLAVVNVSGFIVALVVAVSGLFFRQRVRARWLFTELLLLAAAVLSTAAGHFVFARRMGRLRLEMGVPVDLVPLDNPARLAFQSLHSYSVVVLSIGMLAALAALLAIAWRNR